MIKDDRPYAGWLYLGLAYNARTEKKMDVVEIDIGMVGPASMAREAQNWMHQIRDIEHFNGWGIQLRNELGIQLVKERKMRVLAISNPGWPKIDAVTDYGFSLGNVKTYLNAGMEMRIGSYLPNDFGTSPIRPANDSNAPLPEQQSRRLSDGDVAAGLAWQWVGGKITYAHILRSKEFREQKDAQNFGSITLSLEY